MSLELGLLGEILAQSRDPDVNVQSFGELVARSPRLAAEVVRVSNSALYGMEGKITRLERAVLILGISTVAQIASTLLVGDALRNVEIGNLCGDTLWLHSLETGLCAQLLARCLGLPMESEAYLCGLLHDLGILTLHEQHGDAYADAMRCTAHGDVALDGLEAAIFGETHGARLALLAAEWDFPEVLQEAIAHHHAPERASALGRPLAMLIQAAHVVVGDPSAGWCDHVSGDEDRRLLEALGLDDQDVRDVREELAERLKEATAVFS